MPIRRINWRIGNPPYGLVQIRTPLAPPRGRPHGNCRRRCPSKGPSDNLPLARRSGVPPLKQCGGTPHLRAGTPARRLPRPASPRRHRRRCCRAAKLPVCNFRSRFGGCWLMSPGTRPWRTWRARRRASRRPARPVFSDSADSRKVRGARSFAGNGALREAANGRFTLKGSSTLHAQRTVHQRLRSTHPTRACFARPAPLRTGKGVWDIRRAAVVALVLLLTGSAFSGTQHCARPGGRSRQRWVRGVKLWRGGVPVQHRRVRCDNRAVCGIFKCSCHNRRSLRVVDGKHVQRYADLRDRAQVASAAASVIRSSAIALMCL